MHPPETTGTRPASAWVLLLVLLIGATTVYALASEPRADVARHATFTLGSSLLFGLAVWKARRSLTRLDPRSLLAVLVLSAACLRVAAALAPTSLSDDIHRYVWDGRLVAQGQNPYREPPGAQALPGLEQLNSPKFISVYPPLAQTFFAMAVIQADYLGLEADRAMRLLLGLADVLTVALLVGILAALRQRPWLAALYAWNPLVYWELAGGGHTEALLVPAVALALWAALRARWRMLGIALGLAALAKTTALVFWPALVWFAVRRKGVRGAASVTAWAALLVILGYAPFWFDGLLPNLAKSYALYGGYFIFDSPLYELARIVLGYEEGVTADVGPTVTPWFGFGIAVIALVAALAVNGRLARLAPALYAVAVAQVMLSPVIHPWYFVPALLLGVVAFAWSALGLAALLGLSYLYYLPGIDHRDAGLLWAQYAPFAALLALDVARACLGPVLRRRGRRKFGSFAELLAPGSRLLDIGAGEGYVSLAAARAGHRPMLLEVELAPTPHDGLPRQVYDGRRFPFEPQSYDVGVLSYVLHHCDDPQAVLDEARRVCRRVVVLESVYETAFDRSLLTFLDHLANWFRGIPIEPLQLAPAPVWRARFEALGFRIAEERWLGRFVHKHVLFVLDSA